MCMHICIYVYACGVLYMHACVCMWCVCIHAYMCMYVEPKFNVGYLQYLHFICGFFCLLCVLSQALSLNHLEPIYLGVLVDRCAPAPCILPSTEATDAQKHIWFSVGAWDCSSCAEDCTEGTVTAAPLLSLCSVLFTDRQLWWRKPQHGC